MPKQIDVSSHNGSVDFSKMQNVDFVFIRATIGMGTVDKMLPIHAAAAAAAGKQIGYYHFPYMHSGVDVVEDATKQANFFLETIAPQPAFIHLAADCEEYDDKNLPTSDEHLSADNFELWLKTFFEVIEAQTGNKEFLYSYRDYLDRKLNPEHGLGVQPLWLASYTGEPHKPRGWDTIKLWQYSEKGDAPDVPRTDIDVSRWVQS